MFDAYEKHRAVFDEHLNLTLDKLSKDAPDTICDAMRYSLLNGGKRIRPVLALAAAEMLGVERRRILPYALAIECIHTFSLVHDDLPAMDNDDYRRGNLSTHKKFGEAYGILCGDALLAFAFEHILSTLECFDVNDVAAMKILAEYSGYSGMVGGQVLDLENQGKLSDIDGLYSVYMNKTAKLLTAPLLISSYLSGGKCFDELKNYGEHLGIAFQITDDILDVIGDKNTLGKTPNKDEKEDKFTAVKLLSLDGAKNLACSHYDVCLKIAEKFPVNDFFDKFTAQVRMRMN